MRGFVTTLGLVIGLFLFFVLGLFAAQSGLMIISFCAAPFAIFALGWSAKGMLGGKKIRLVEAESNLSKRQPQEATPAPIQRRLTSEQAAARRISTGEQI